ncbi:homoserine O-acetyltransferase [Halomarina halobia]|uniref:Homoserine O-acetyltransferase n=1 Tax=Halomarina halobia TaxID=3033386 RepID=A0ABD6A8R2_9EURY|nr:homoserine O-acetyltransferase [Halomarina sp. PSR21]
MTERVSLGPFEFACGESIPDLELAYETYGEYDGGNAVLVCHALTGSAHVANVARTGAEESGVRGGGGRTARDTDGQARAWWNDVVGPAKAIDTTEYFVVCANVPGSCYGSSGPPATNPETGEPYGTDFPAVTVADWTRAQARLLDHLGVDRLHAVVGGSVGGMNALDWAKRYPDRVDRVGAIATAARLDPQCLAIDAVARRAITSDPKWEGGDYYPGDGPTEGLGLARQLGHVMYLSKNSMDAKFGRRAAGRAVPDTFPADPGAGFFTYRDVESYLDYQAERFVDRFDANSYLYLTRAMDDYDLAEGYTSDADALAAFDGQALCVSYTGDWHFTVEQAETVAEAFRATGTPTAHHIIESDHGHDAFLVEPGKLGPALRGFLASGVRAGPITDTASSTDRPSQFAPVHTSLFS